MAETNDTGTAAPVDTKVPGNIVSAGKPSIATFTKPAEQNDNGGAAAADAGAGAAGDGKKPELTDAEKAAAIEAEKNKLPDLSDDQTNKLISKALGIENFDGNIDAIKEKLKPAAAAQSPEDIEKEKKANEAAFDKRMLDHFIANGGSAENFVALKQVAAADLKALSESEIRRELKDNGFSDDDITTVLKERYYQINPEELTQGENETADEFEKRKALTEKKIAFGSKKLESKSSFIKKQAVDALGVLREAINFQDLQKAEEAKLSSKADELAKKLPRKLTFELGFLDDKNTKKIDPIEYDVSENDIAEVVDTLKDPEKRNKFLFNEDNSLNLDNVGAVMLRNKYLESALKASYLEGGNRQVSEFEKIFPGRIAKDIGVGGASGGGGGRKGVIASAGKPQVVVRNS